MQVGVYVDGYNLYYYGVYSSALATGSLPQPLGVQFASSEPPTLRT
jgi:hypothetical protein